MTELNRTYGNFRVYGEVQGMERNYAFQDDPTKSGYERNQVKFDVKTDEDNIVTVELQGLKFDAVNIQTRERENRKKKSLPYTADVYKNIPEDYQIVMGVTVGLEQGKDGKNIRKEFTSYDAAREIYENLKDGDIVFISGNNDLNVYTNRNGEEVVQMRQSIQRIYKSNKEIDFADEDFKPTSAFDQNLILQAVDVDKKEKKAYVQTYLVHNKSLDFTTFTFWVDGNKQPKFVKNLMKLPFGTALKAEGNLVSSVKYSEPEAEDDGWGASPAGYEDRSIKEVDKSYEITKVLPETIEEGKYTTDDFIQVEADDSPFNDNSDSDWGSDSNSGEKSPFDDDSIENDDPFAL